MPHAKGHIPWNKGKKGLQVAWNKGKSMPTAIGNTYSKGRTPWNKGKKGVMPIAWNRGLKGFMSGEKNASWKGGVSKPNKLEREKFRKLLQTKVFIRDNYTCQICDQYSGYLQVDHIKSWAEYPELRFELSNCRTLCMACHYYITFKRKLPKGVVWGHNLNQRIG